jgi:hypothetical protein
MKEMIAFKVTIRNYIPYHILAKEPFLEMKQI